MTNHRFTEGQRTPHTYGDLTSGSYNDVFITAVGFMSPYQYQEHFISILDV